MCVRVLWCRGSAGELCLWQWECVAVSVYIVADQEVERSGTGAEDDTQSLSLVTPFALLLMVSGFRFKQQPTLCLPRP